MPAVLGVWISSTAGSFIPIGLVWTAENDKATTMITLIARRNYPSPAVFLFVLTVNFNLIQVVHAEGSVEYVLITIAQIDNNVNSGLGGYETASNSTMQEDVWIENEVRCLALNIYFEARSEPRKGQRAVGHVVMNRVANTNYPNTVCEVVQQGGEERLYRCQFSWWCDGRSDIPSNKRAWQRSMELAEAIYFGHSKDPTGGALWYHAAYANPFWSDTLTLDVTIGQHAFYVKKGQPKYASN